MADTSNLTNFLTDVAKAIKDKKGITEQIPAANFDTEILSIEGGIDTSDATAQARDIISGKTAYVNKQKITGSIPVTYMTLETNPEDIYTSIPSYCYSSYKGKNMCILPDGNRLIMVNNAINVTDSNGNIINSYPYTSFYTGFLSEKIECLNVDICGKPFEDGACMIIFSVAKQNSNSTLKYTGFVVLTYYKNSELKYIRNDGQREYLTITNLNEYGSSPIIFATGNPNDYTCICCSDKSFYILLLNEKLGYTKSGTGSIAGDANTLIPNAFYCDNGKYICGKGNKFYMYNVSNNLNNLLSTSSSTGFFITYKEKIYYIDTYGNLYNITDIDLVKSNALNVDVEHYINSGKLINNYLVVNAGPEIRIYEIKNITTGDIMLLNSLPLNNFINTADNNYGLVYTDYEKTKFIICTNTSTSEGLLLTINEEGINQVLKTITYDNVTAYSAFDTDATADNLLDGKTAYANNKKITGTMPNNGEINIIPSTENQNIPLGYTSGGTVQGDNNLLPENIKKDVTIFDITGTLDSGIDTSDANATSNQIAEGATAYVKNEKVTGTLKNADSVVNHYPTEATYTNLMGNLSVLTAVSDNTENEIVTPNTEIQIAITNDRLASGIQLTPEKLVKGNTILGVEGIAEIGGSTDVPVKLFETEEQMQADTTAKENDLALVYAQKMEGITQDTEFQVCEFPDTVTLDTAIIDDFYGDFIGVDSSAYISVRVELSSMMFRFEYYGDNNGVVEYMSEDGITYIRTDTLGNPIDLGTVVKCSYDWNDALSKFIFVKQYNFGGLYKYGTEQNNNLLDAYKNPKCTNRTLGYDELTSIDIASIQRICDLVMSNFKSDYGTFNSYLLVKKSQYIYNLYALLQTNNYWGLPGVYNDGTNKYISASYVYKNTDKFLKMTVDLEHNTYTQEEKSYLTYDYMRMCETFDSTDLITTISVSSSFSPNTSLQVFGKNNSTNGSNTNRVDVSISYSLQDAYYPAPTQLNLQNSNELLPGKIGYGKNGVVISDGSIIQPDNTFADIPAQLYCLIQTAYDNMEPIVLTDDNNRVNNDIRFIPVKTDGTPLLDTSNVTNMDSTFSECVSLETIPQLNTSNVTNMANTFWNCNNLKTISQLDTHNVTTMRWMFLHCSNLKIIPQLNTSNVTDMNSMFEDCTNLTNESLNNILAMCINAVKLTTNKTLKYIGLTQEQANTCATLSNYSAFISAGWTTGY